MKDEDAGRAHRARAEADRGAQDRVREALHRQARQDHRGRRPRPGRAEDGQGLPGREAPHPAGRQDGRPPRQQGRRVDDRPGRGHAVHGRRHHRRHRAEPAGRAEPNEHRPGAGSAPGLGREGPGPEDPAHARGSSRRSRELRKFLDQIYNHDKKLHGARVDLDAVQRQGTAAPGRQPDRRRADGDAGVRRRRRVRDQGDAAPGRPAGPAARPSCTTAAPARRSIARSPSATCTCSS